MRYVAAALLVALGGGEVSEANIKKLLDGVGIDCDSEKASIIVKELAGKNLEELIAEGNGKLASVPSGGAAPATAAAGGAAPAAAAAVEEVKEEEPAEESDDDMGFGLFD